MTVQKTADFPIQFDRRLTALTLHLAKQRSRRRETKPFEYKPFSLKQKKILTWWHPDSPVSHKEGIIADGAIRSGKTTAMSISYGLWAMHMFDQQNFLICGKTIGSLRRNVIRNWTRQMRALGYRVKDRRTDNLLIVTKGEVINYFYLFGGNTEGSQDLVQGITAAGVFFDEVALMPQSFVDQAVGRCSVEGSKMWFNCNPGHPKHWFKTEWLDKLLSNKPEGTDEFNEDGDAIYKDLVHLHFTMDDNPSLSEKVKARYRTMHSGVFYRRFVLGLWVAAEGVIYEQFVNYNDVFILKPEEVPKKFSKIVLGIDWGDNKSGHSFTATGYMGNYTGIVPLRTEKHAAKELTPAMLEQKVTSFVKRVIADFGPISEIYCDHINTYINGCRVALEKEGIYVPITTAYKCPVIERILVVQKMLALGSLKLTRECESLVDALNMAVWDSKRPDERLDNGTSDIDSLDSFEYSFSTYIDLFTRNLSRK